MHRMFFVLTIGVVGVSAAFLPAGRSKAQDKVHPLASLLAPNGPAKLTQTQRDAVKSLVAGTALTSAQRDLLGPLTKANRPGVTGDMRQAIANGLRRDLLHALVAGSNPAKLNQNQRDVVKAVLANSALSRMQRDLLETLRNAKNAGITNDMRQALSDALQRDQERTAAQPAKTPPKIVTKLPPKEDKVATKKNPLDPLLDPKNPLGLSLAQQEATKALQASRSLTQAQRNVLTSLRSSSIAGLTDEMRAALANGLRRDLERRKTDSAKTSTPTVNAGILRKLNDPSNPYNLSLPQRSAAQNLIARKTLTKTQRDLLEGLRDHPPAGLPVEIVAALNDALRRAPALTAKQEPIRTIAVSLPAGTKVEPANKGKTREIGAALQDKHKQVLAANLDAANPVKLSKDQQQAMALLAKGQPLTQVQRNQLFPLVGSKLMTADLRLALLNGLRDDIDKKAKTPSEAKTDVLNPLLDPENPAKLDARQREAMQRLMAGSKLHDHQRNSLFDLLRNGAKGKDDKGHKFLNVLQRIGILRGLKDDRHRCEGLAHSSESGGHSPPSSGEVSSPPGSTTESESTSPPVGDDTPGVISSDESSATKEAETPPTEEKTASPKAKSGPSTNKKRQSQRFLFVENATEGKLTLYVQFYTQKDGEWAWTPGSPDEKDSETVKMEIEADEAVNLTADDTPVSAAKVRIWAVSTGGAEWNEYKTQDLLLVPEEDDQGERFYLAEEIDTFTYTFSKD